VKPLVLLMVAALLIFFLMGIASRPAGQIYHGRFRIHVDGCAWDVQSYYRDGTLIQWQPDLHSPRQEASHWRVEELP